MEVLMTVPAFCRLALAFVTLAAVFASANRSAAQDVVVTSQTRQVLDFYGGRSAIHTLSEMPRRSPIQPASTGQLQHNGKPFQEASTGPTVSPYLNLFRDEHETSDSVPSYYTLVRPQLEQQATFQQQQRQIQQLQRQVQGKPQYRASTASNGGMQARYFDTAQFYGGWQR
jgi:hypothetical protein